MEQINNELGFLAGGGEMGALIRAKDWAATDMGPASEWPQSLRTALRLLINSGHPMYIFWGEKGICFYNDAYRPTLGPERHPSSLGCPAPEVWKEIWPVIGPQIAQVMTGAGSTWHENQLIPVTRNGKTEDVYWTYSYNPIDDLTAPGGIGGVLVVCSETTAQVRTHQRLTQSEARLDLALSSGRGIGTFDWDVVNNRLYADERLARMYGIDPARAAAGPPLAEFFAAIHPEDLPDVTSRIDEALLTGDPFSAEYRLHGSGGEEIWVLAEGRCELAADGTPLRFPGVSIDITDRKMVEEDRQRLVSIVEKSPDFIGSADLSGKPFFLNSAGRKLIGLDPDSDISNISIPDFFIAEQRSFVAQVVRPAAMTEGRWSGELTFQHFKTHEPIAVLYDVFRIDDPKTGKPVNFATITRDITASKRTEAKLREADANFMNLADTMPQLAWIADAGTDGQIHWFNKSWLEYTGATLEDMLGTGWSAVHHPDHAERVVKKFAHHVKHGLDWEDVFPLRGRDGQFRWFLSRMNVIRDDSGSVARIFGTNTDITEHRDMADQLQRQAAELSEADRRKDEFLATLAHELRNPLAPMRNALQIMRLKGGQDESLEPVRSMMERQLVQMVRLVDDLLDVSRVSRGKLELIKNRTDLQAVVNSAVEASRPLLDANGIQLKVILPPQPLFLDADLTRLAQVFINLLNNAAKFTPRGGHVELWAEQQNREVVITVKDSGIGISATDLPGIFEMFWQVDSSLERSQGGLGIGLTLVRRLVELHGGSIEAHSEGAGHGSSFIVRLPGVDTPHRDLAGAEETDAIAASSLKILVVDDNRDAATSLATLLQMMGNDTRAVHDGQGALAAASSFRPDVVLLDIGLPDLNGYEVARRLREQHWGKNIALYALTGWGQDEDRRRSQEAGFDHHMVKPVDHAVLAELLAGMIKTPQAAN